MKLRFNFADIYYLSYRIQHQNISADLNQNLVLSLKQYLYSMTTEIQRQLSPPLSPRPLSNFSSSSNNQPLTTSAVGRIVNAKFKEGQVVKGNSRINYMPYEKKVLQYQDRKIVKKIPVKRKVIEYQERKYIEKIPREVVKTGYYPVQRFSSNSKEKVISQRPSSNNKISFVSIEKQYIQDSRSISVHKNRGQTQTLIKPKMFRAQDEYNLMIKKPSKKIQGQVGSGKKEFRYLSTEPSPAKRSNSSRKFNVKISYQNTPDIQSQQNKCNDPYQIS